MGDAAVAAPAVAAPAAAVDDDGDEPQVHPLVLEAEQKQAQEFSRHFGHGGTDAAAAGAGDESSDDEFGPKPLAEAAGSAAQTGSSSRGVKYVVYS